MKSTTKSKTFLPVITITDGDTVLNRFDSFTDMYDCKEPHLKQARANLYGNATAIFLFGELPLRYDITTHKFYKATSAYEADNQWKEL